MAPVLAGLVYSFHSDGDDGGDDLLSMEGGGENMMTVSPHCPFP